MRFFTTRRLPFYILPLILRRHHVRFAKYGPTSHLCVLRIALSCQTLLPRQRSTPPALRIFFGTTFVIFTISQIPPWLLLLLCIESYQLYASLGLLLEAAKRKRKQFRIVMSRSVRVDYTETCAFPYQQR